VSAPVFGFEKNGYHARGLGIVMADWTVKLLEQWAVVTAAPIPFAIAIVAAAAVICLVVGWSYRGVLSKNAQIELQDRRLSDYRDKLKGSVVSDRTEKFGGHPVRIITEAALKEVSLVPRGAIKQAFVFLSDNVNTPTIIGMERSSVFALDRAAHKHAARKCCHTRDHSPID
jgi:hypothetical protein